MTTKRFLDAHVLVAAADLGSPERCQRARAVIRDLQREGRGVVSTQVLQEFYVAATTTLGIEPMTAKALVRDFTRFEVVTSDAAHLQEAIDLSVLSRLSVWDALIVVAAASASCGELVTEALPAGTVIRGVTIVHPMAERAPLPAQAGADAPKSTRRTRRRRRRARRDKPDTATADQSRPKPGGTMSAYQPELGLEP
ncbi:MAG: PIN domain-containing protein [Planctomycetes bacterium]|nr:PIN domain-containing protein [Planctomycetota bacterium]